jgi:hypothetical protein
MDCDEDCECWVHRERLQYVNGLLADEAKLAALAREVEWPILETEIRLEEMAAECVKAMLERHPELFEEVSPGLWRKSEATLGTRPPIRRLS